MRMESGVLTAHDRIMTSNVTQSACGSPGFESSARQLVRPDGWIWPMPSQVVKLRASTPISGMTPNAMNIASAGSAIHATGPLRPPLVVVVAWPTPAVGGAGVVICR
jgi:hypothetical protein